MILKLVAILILLGGVSFLCISCVRATPMVEAPIDQAWWDGLSEEWKTILLISQNLSKQHADIYAVQQGYMNRMNSDGEEDLSELNTSLHRLNAESTFQLSHRDFYARAVKYEFVTPNDSIDLKALGNLDLVYMVSGPGDLTPLKKFPNLKVLIMNSCGIDEANAIRSPAMDLGPLRDLKKLEVLHCSTPVLRSIEPIEQITSLRKLRIDHSSISDLSPLKQLVHLEMLSVGANGKSASAIAKLTDLKVLHLDGPKNVPDLSKLDQLKSLTICEDELALVDGSYRVKSLEFLKALHALEFLDLEYTTYRGDLAPLDPLKNLKAITLPPINSAAMLTFKAQHKNCVIINAYQYER